MNRYAMQHIMDSSFCFPISENEIEIRLQTARDDMKWVELIYESKYVFGMTQKRVRMNRAYSSELYDYYTIRLQLEDTRLAYVFYVNDGYESCFFSEDGITRDYDYTKGFYNFFQYPYINQADIMEEVDWMKEAVFYQIFVDRFYMGDKDKDTSYINCRWGDIPTPFSFAGGDLRGITEKLDYIMSFGCSALYLTPVFRSISNHKYDISDYYAIDPEFGTAQDLKTLVEEAHRRGMHVVLDAVFNHCSDRMMQFQDVIAKGRESKYYDWFFIHGDRVERNEHGYNYETFASCDYMPKLNTSNPSVQEYLIGIGCHYLREYGIDGWRLDVSDEVSHDFWRAFRKAIKGCNKNAVIIGENWHNAYSNLRGDQYDSIMNYAFTKACLDYFAQESMDARHFAWKLNDLLMRNTDTVNAMMLNLLDSHDTHRFISEVGGKRFQMKAALCLLYLFPGVPCIYYGTEILTSGGYDPDSRRCMDWSRTDRQGEYADIYELLSHLAQLRKEYAHQKISTDIRQEKGVFILTQHMVSEKLHLYINNTDARAVLGGQEIQKRSYMVVKELADGSQIKVL